MSSVPNIRPARKRTTKDCPAPDFGAALAETIEQQGLSQESVAKALGVTQGTIANWINGAREPHRRHVFELERVLGIAPGSLARHLGYGPPVEAAGQPRLTFEEVVMADPTISEEIKRSLVTLYRSAQRAHQHRPRRRSSS